jgi:signal transduction histidine kinase
MAEITFLKDISTEMALAVKLMHPALNSETLAEAFVALDRQIASELHDTLAQDLAFLRLKLDHLSGNGEGRAVLLMQQDLQAMRRSVHQAYQQVRGRLNGMYPASGGELIPALALVIEGIRRQSKLGVQFRMEGQARRLPEQVSHNIAAIVQEALVNASKHSHADNAEVRLIWAKGGLFVQVADNGIGFNMEQAQVNGHIGLKLMAERARAIQGQLEVESLPGTGTEVTLRIALPPVENHVANHAVPTHESLKG